MTFAPRARAQQTAPSAGRTSQQKLPRIGVLWPDAAPAVRIEEFRQGLRDLGYIEGENIVIEYRYAEGRRERLPTLAAELAGSNVDVIVALTTLAARPAKDATNTIPIVMISGDPIGTGLVSNLARPGGNVTGLTFFSPDLAGKRLEVLKELVPALTRVGIVWDVQGPAKAIEFAAASAAAGDLGLEVESIEVQAPAGFGCCFRRRGRAASRRLAGPREPADAWPS
jgi:putative ABC transport system substrate-binding protein